MSKEYRDYNEWPTVIWFAVIMILSFASLVCGVLLKVNAVVSVILFATGIVLGSIGTTIFIMTIIYPIVASFFRKPTKYDDE